MSELLQELENKTSQGKHLVNVDGPAQPAVLAKLLGIGSVQQVYQGRQNGKLPADPNATYVQCLTHHITYWKDKAAKKNANIAEAALRQKIELDRAKTETEWLNIKEKRRELIDVSAINDIFEPVFLHIKTQLVSIARKNPDVQEEIDNLLEGWFHLGGKILKSGEEDLDEFIDKKMNQELELEDEEPTEEFSDES